MNNIRYQALFAEQPEGGYTVTFPDLPEAITEGDSMEDQERLRYSRLRAVNMQAASGFPRVPASRPLSRYGRRVWRKVKAFLTWHARCTPHGLRHSVWNPRAPTRPCANLNAPQRRWDGG